MAVPLGKACADGTQLLGNNPERTMVESGELKLELSAAGSAPRVESARLNEPNTLPKSFPGDAQQARPQRTIT